MTNSKASILLMDDGIQHMLNLNERASERLNERLNERELVFLKLVCSECTYKEIAYQMYLSPRTIDGYRDALFEKLHVRTRVGLVLYAIRNRIVPI